MSSTQLNIKLPDNLMNAAKNYAENFGFRNVQDLIYESLREKIFEKNIYDENFNSEEIDLIDKLISNTIRKNDFSSEEKLNKILLQ